MIKFRLVGYPRSGQHAIIHWLFLQMSDRYCVHLNNYTERSSHQVRFYCGEKIEPNRVVAALEEDSLVSYGLEGCADNQLQIHLPSIYIVRDVRNHYASLIKHRYTSEKNFLPIWREYAELALNPPENSVVVLFDKWASDVIYRRRLFYRICNLIGVGDAIFTDNGRDFVPGAGGGSSFDGTSKRGSKMNVLERYKQVALPKISEEILGLNRRIFGDRNS